MSDKTPADVDANVAASMSESKEMLDDIEKGKIAAETPLEIGEEGAMASNAGFMSDKQIAPGTADDQAIAAGASAGMAVAKAKKGDFLSTAEAMEIDAKHVKDFTVAAAAAKKAATAAEAAKTAFDEGKGTADETKIMNTWQAKMAASSKAKSNLNSAKKTLITSMAIVMETGKAAEDTASTAAMEAAVATASSTKRVPKATVAQAAAMAAGEVDLDTNGDKAKAGKDAFDAAIAAGGSKAEAARDEKFSEAGKSVLNGDLGPSFVPLEEIGDIDVNSASEGDRKAVFQAGLEAGNDAR
jgi:hypothetical protein